MTTLGNGIDGFKVGIGELNALEVGLNALGVGALGENDVATAQTPGNKNLSKGVAALLGDLVQSLVLADPLTGGGNLVLRAQRRVGHGHNVLGEAVLHQLLVGQEGVNLDLVGVRHDLGELGHLLKVGNGPVGDTNGPGLAILINLLHSAPCGLGVLGQVLENDVLFYVSGARRKKKSFRKLPRAPKSYMILKLTLPSGPILGSPWPFFSAAMGQ